MTDQGPLTNLVAVVLAGGQGSRLHELTAQQCKPAVHFTRSHRIVDFTMAGLARAQVGQVIVGTQYCPDDLAAHIRRTWTTHLPDSALHVRYGPNVALGQGYAGTADVLRQNAAMLDEMGAREVLVVAADHVYDMDYRDFVAAHRATDAALTMAAMPVPRAEANRFGIVAEGEGRRVTAFLEKPSAPPAMPGDASRSLASLGIYVIDWRWLRDVLTDPEMIDFGHDVIPYATAHKQAAVWRWEGYWRDVGTLQGLRETWLDFEGRVPPCALPHATPEGTARLTRMAHKRALPQDVLVSSARLTQSVLMPGAHVGRGASLDKVIVGPNVQIPAGLHVGQDKSEDSRWFRVAGDTTLVTQVMLQRREAALYPAQRPSQPFRISGQK